MKLAVQIVMMLVAITALGLGAYQMHVFMRHNRLSLQPRMSISSYRNNTGTGWSSVNNGIGPAEIRSFEVSIDGKPVHSWTEFAEKLKIPIGNREATYRILYPGQLVKPGGPTPLFVMKGKDMYHFLWAQLSRVRIAVCYCSLYEECWIASSLIDEDGHRKECPYQEDFKFSG